MALGTGLWAPDNTQVTNRKIAELQNCRINEIIAELQN